MATRGDWEEEIHRRLLSGDPLASYDLCQRLLEPLTRYVRKKALGIIKDEHLITDTATDALLEYITAPHKFDPDKGKSLFGYLCMAAHGNLLNIIASQRRRSSREVSLTPVEDAQDWGNIDIEDTSSKDVLADILASEESREWNEWVHSVITDPTERKVVSMIAEGERKTEAFAQVLGLQQLLKEEQKRQVKRVKDRLLKRLKRAYTKRVRHEI